MALFLKIVVISYLWLYNTKVQSAVRIPRLSLADPQLGYYYNYAKGSYKFGYDVSDSGTGNIQYRNEERYPNGTVVGGYGYVDPFGRIHRYQYIADEKGYRVKNDSPKTADKIQIFNIPKASTEASITWTRPNKKKKTQQAKLNASTPIANNHKYFELKPPSYYAIE